VAHGELDGVRPEIARSWLRTRQLFHVDPALQRVPVLSAEELEKRSERDEVLSLARPILQPLGTALRGTGHLAALVDAEGWVLWVGGDQAAAGALAGISFVPGAHWSERVAGTNGAGTALTDRRPTEIFAAEHFVHAWQDWTSAASPIALPGTGEQVAALDVIGPWDAPEPQGVAVATSMAAVVEERLRSRASVRAAIVRYAMSAARGLGEAMVAVDERGRVLQANDAAGRVDALQDGQLPAAARERFLAALRGGAREDELALEWSGARGERRRAVCTLVRHDERPVGALLRLVAPPGPRARSSGGPRLVPPVRPWEAILGGSVPLAAALHLAQVAARNDLPVVLYGETGTGKELFAQGIHAAGPRSEQPLVVLNCGAIPATLIEAELFGYEPGTFTGGQREGKAGKLEEADRGTLFLDEVSELPPPAQTALLRVLQEHEVVRLGGSRTRPVDVRIVAATNRRLDEEVAAGRFRRDLFFRLNVLSIDLPPLRERTEDVPDLARACLAEAEERTGRSGLSLSDAAIQALQAHCWPGNVRELRNVILRAAAVVATPPIQPADLLLVDLCDAPAAPVAAAQPDFLEIVRSLRREASN